MAEALGWRFCPCFQTFFMLLGSSPNLSANPLVPLCSMDIIIVFVCLLSTQWGNMSQYMFVKHFAQETTKKHILSIAHSHQHWFPPLSISHFQLFDGILPVARSLGWLVWAAELTSVVPMNRELFGDSPHRWHNRQSPACAIGSVTEMMEWKHPRMGSALVMPAAFHLPWH